MTINFAVWAKARFFVSESLNRAAFHAFQLLLQKIGLNALQTLGGFTGLTRISEGLLTSFANPIHRHETSCASVGAGVIAYKNLAVEASSAPIFNTAGFAV